MDEYSENKCEKCGRFLTVEEDESEDDHGLCDRCAGRDRCGCGDPHCSCSGIKDMRRWG